MISQADKRLSQHVRMQAFIAFAQAEKLIHLFETPAEVDGHLTVQVGPSGKLKMVVKIRGGTNTVIAFQTGTTQKNGMHGAATTNLIKKNREYFSLFGVS